MPFLPAAIVAQVSPAPSPSPSPDAAVAARAREWLHRLQTADIDRTQLTATMNQLLTDQLAKTLAAQFGPLGDPVSFDLLQSGTEAGSQYYVYHAAFKDGTALNFVYAVDARGKVSGLRFIPPQ
jgi:hypothetical protein